MRRWRDAGIAPLTMAVNVSMLQLRNAKEFVKEVTETLARWSLNPVDLELDVTEAILAQVSWARNDVLMDLRQIGVRIALDDFGTDYSSFDYLRKYHINHIKITRTFIDSATLDPEHAQTIRAIINLAHDLHIDVIAEGVETADERALLVSIGATTTGQGLYFSAVVSASEASDLLRKGMIAPSIPVGPAQQIQPSSPEQGGPAKSPRPLPAAAP
jgi:EAL domain-containing protein (putative c-di-GMP-specific phosphodiesterase class I)